MTIREGGAAPEVRWHPLTRIGFRFAVCYFGLFCAIFGQILWVFAGYPIRWLPADAVVWQMTVASPGYEWVGRAVFGVDTTLHVDSGSGDQAAIWLLVFCIAIVAAVATALWSVLDRRRPAYPTLFAWFLTVMRLCLAGQMLFYGTAKLIPTQMPAPPLDALLTPFGQFSPMSVLWLQVGSAPAYEMLLGAAEVLAGLLLVLPRTATLGALLSVVSMLQVFVLNMTYDVPVKILSFHLLLLSLVVLAPQLRRLADVIVLERHSEPARQPALFATARRNRTAAAVQVALGVWVLVGCLAIGAQSWLDYGGGRERSPLYGIWSVSAFSVDGVALPPLTTDETRWQRLVFDEIGAMTLQRMDGTLTQLPAAVDATSIRAEQPPIHLAYTRPAPDRLQLDGTVDGRAVRITLTQVDLNSFVLRSRGFNWVQEYPVTK